MLNLCFVDRPFVPNKRVYADGAASSRLHEKMVLVLLSISFFQYVDKLNVGDRLDLDHFP